MGGAFNEFGEIDKETILIEIGGKNHNEIQNNSLKTDKNLFF